MDYVMQIAVFTVIILWMSGGALFALSLLLLYRAGESFHVFKGEFPVIRASSKVKLSYLLFILILLYFVVCISYLFYPNYFYIGESTGAYLGKVLIQGVSLYPTGDMYPYHGLLYGPVLAEVQYLVQKLGFPIIPSSKIPGIISFFLVIVLWFKIFRKDISKGYLFCLFPFGAAIFINSANPVLLLIVCCALLLSSFQAHNRTAAIVMGILAGVASAMKLHGAVYVLAAYLAILLVPGSVSFSAILMALSAIFSFLVCYLPPTTSLSSFFNYIRLASHHGLSLKVFLETLVFYVFINIPIFYLLKNRNVSFQKRIIIGIIVSLEFLVVIIASKPGSGTHHLLPFVPVNAFIIQSMDVCYSENWMRSVKLLACSLFVSSLAMVCLMSGTMLKRWGEFNAAKNEIITYGEKYPNLVLYPTDISTARLNCFRVLLSVPQFDCFAFYDLKFAGIREEALIAKLEKSELKVIALPNKGDAFSIHNGYNMKPLFSDEVRYFFHKNYRLTESGKFYNIFTPVHSEE